MKSAYELAMERLNQSAPQASLTKAQKEEIADIDNRFTAKIAEKQVFLNGLIAKARFDGDREAEVQLVQQLKSEVARMESDMEEAKEKVRNSRD